MTRRSLVVSLSIALLGSPPAAATGSDKEELGILESDVDYDGIVDHTKPPDPRQVKKLLGYILDGMDQAHSADRQTQHLGRNRLLDHYINRFLDRYFGRRKTIKP